jgi:hypothetical protein
MVKMKLKFFKSNKQLACLFLFLNLLLAIKTYSQTNFDSSGKWAHSFCIGMPMHKFPEFAKFNFPQTERNASWHSSLPLYLEYNISKNKGNFNIYYYSYSWLKLFDDNNFEPINGTLVYRGFGLINLSFMRSIPLIIKKKLILEFHIGLNVPYRFDGMDEIYLFRIPPFEVRSDAIFYRRLGIGFNCGLEKHFFKRFRLVARYNYQYFNEPAHSYPVKGMTNYGPNRKMNVLQFGLGYSINHKNLIGLFKKKDS